MTGHYDFAVTPESTYGRAARMVARHAGPGVVVDLGCSYGRIAEVIAAAGRTYIGIDLDDEARASLSERGHESHRLDLADNGLVARLAEIVGQREVSAVLALDVIEHLPSPSSLLASLATLFTRWGDPVLVMSVPNIAHRDLGAKLLAGRWDLTETGLLDRTHLSLFTEQRLTAELAEHGFRSVDVDDVIMPTAHDQRVPEGHPFLAEGTPLAGLLSWLRSLPDDRGDTYQFVRTFRRSEPPVVLPSAVRGTDAPDLTVILGSWAGGGLDGLGETLACLAAQDAGLFEVLIPAAPGELAALGCLVDPLAARVRLIPVGDDDLAGQSNRCMDAARGALVALLAAGDLVTPGWVRCFVEASAAHPGAVVRARSVRCSSATIGEMEESLAETAPFTAERFDLWRHLTADQIPLGSFALPAALGRQSGLRFAAEKPALIWRFTFLAAMLAGVADLDQITCIHRYVADESDPRELAVALGEVPIFLPAGWAGRLQGDRNHLAYLTGELQVTKDRLASVSQAHEDLNASRFWRVTGPARRGIGWWRTGRRHRR